jgi:hypothetical protein
MRSRGARGDERDETPFRATGVAEEGPGRVDPGDAGGPQIPRSRESAGVDPAALDVRCYQIEIELAVDDAGRRRLRRLGAYLSLQSPGPLGVAAMLWQRSARRIWARP